MTKVLYRYASSHYAEGYLDEWGDWHTTGEDRIDLFVVTYPVLKETAKGHWIELSQFPTKKRFVLRNARKHFACETEEAALESFIARKHRQIVHLSAQLHYSKKALSLAEARKSSPQPIDTLPPSIVL